MNIWITPPTTRAFSRTWIGLRSCRCDFPLWGIPFAIKDNIDLAGVPTTAGCAEYAYTPDESAAVVERLIAAGAIPLGKTNLDQFATGLVGTRSPYGETHNALAQRTDQRRLELWLRRRGRSRPSGFLAGHGYGRLGPRACRPEWSGRL